MQNRVAIIIPARMGSSRFPGKPMAMIAGKSMIERVWRIAKACPSATRVAIATDDESLRAFCEGFGAEVLMTRSDCATGTDRVAEALTQLGEEYDIVFSLQGDAPVTPPWVVESVIQTMITEPEVRIATPIVQVTGEALQKFIASKQAGSSTGTCVTFDMRGYALYFSKGLIPHARDPKDLENLPLYRHIGLYGYRTEALVAFNRLPEGQFEKVEQLEQLRAMEHGIPIRVVTVDCQGRTHASVDRPEDVQTVEEIITHEGELLP